MAFFGLIGLGLDTASGSEALDNGIYSSFLLVFSEEVDFGVAFVVTDSDVMAAGVGLAGTPSLLVFFGMDFEVPLLVLIGESEGVFDA